jgi:hypothetical protein
VSDDRSRNFPLLILGREEIEIPLFNIRKRRDRDSSFNIKIGREEIEIGILSRDTKMIEINTR